MRCKEIKLEDISTASHGQKIRQGLVFLHAIITNLGEAADIEIDKIMPSIGYQETTFEMPIKGRWKAFGSNEPKIYDFPEVKNENDLIKVTREREKTIPLNASSFQLSMKAFEFHSRDYSDRPINARVGKEISIFEKRISLPARSSVLVKWILTFRGTSTNDLDFLPRGVLPPSCATQVSRDEQQWKNHKIFNGIDLVNKCYQTTDNQRTSGLNLKIGIGDLRRMSTVAPKRITPNFTVHSDHFDSIGRTMDNMYERHRAEEEERLRRIAEDEYRRAEDNRRRAENARTRFMSERFFSTILLQRASELDLFLSKTAAINLISWQENAKIEFNNFKTRLVGR